MHRTVLISLVAAALGFAVGRFTLAGKIAELERRVHSSERTRDVVRGVEATVGTTIARAVSATRSDVPSAVPVAPSCPPCEQREDDYASLMKRLAAVAEKVDLGGTEAAIEEDHAKTARRVRDDFFAKANLDDQQRAAIAPIVAQLDEALRAPLDRVDALESADHYAVSDWSEARVDVYRALASAEGSLRAQLSPQQRDALDNTEFSIASQLGIERYKMLIGRGLFTDNAMFIDEAPPQ